MRDQPVTDRGGPAGPHEPVRSPDKITGYVVGPHWTREAAPRQFFSVGGAGTRVTHPLKKGALP